MIRRLLALCALALATPISAQVVTVTSPLPDKSGDGHVTVSSMAAQLGVPKGTVLTRCAMSLTYVGPKSTCPPPATTAPGPVAPVVTTPPKDFGASGQVGYGNTSDVHATRAMDAFPLGVTSAGKFIRNVVVDHARQFITPAKGAILTIPGVIVDRVDAQVTKRGIYIRGASSGWDIGNFRLTYVGSTDTGDYPMGIQLGANAAETVNHITIHDGIITGFRNSLPKGYPNADGIDCERGTHDITIARVLIENVTDGAIDCKAIGLRLDDIVARDVGHRSLRIWGEATAGTITSINPGWAHVWAAKTARLTIAKLIAVGSAPLVDSEAGAVVAIAACDLSGWTGTRALKGAGTVTLGPTCTKAVSR